MTVCSAHRTNGDPCRAHAILGGAVCIVHGGAAPQTRAKAAERIAALVDPAITRLKDLLDDPSSTVALAAVRDILDRAGFGAKQRLEVDIRQQAEQLAAELGLSARDIVAEAERLINGAPQ
jgi:hypothetical protein